MFMRKSMLRSEVHGKFPSRTTYENRWGVVGVWCAYIAAHRQSLRHADGQRRYRHGKSTPQRVRRLPRMALWLVFLHLVA